MTSECQLPAASGQAGLNVLKSMTRQRSLLTALEIMRDDVGPAFQITLPGFQPAVFVGPDSNRQILVGEREHFHWRSESDPVTRLLRHGLLVEDGQQHARLRGIMEPALQKQQVLHHIPAMLAYTDRVLMDWSDGSVQEMLGEMRRIALLILMGTLLDVEFEPDLDRMWQPILSTIKYISPGLWIVWPDAPRPGYKKAIKQMDEYLYTIIEDRRRDPRGDGDLLGKLIRVPGMDDDLIRDQLLTMLIAGHDTSTSLLAWALHLLVQHPAEMALAQEEVDHVLGRAEPTAESFPQLVYLDTIIKETLRLYPPIHVGNRIVAEDTKIAGYELAAGKRTMVSIYLSHRDGRYWQKPEEFQPGRFARGVKRPPAFTYIPFGGGPRNCIGASFAQIEAKVVLTRILQQFNLTDTGKKVVPRMGATLEPHPGVFIAVKQRQAAN